MIERKNKVIAILSRTNDYVTVHAIATELQVSKRTIHNDLNEMIRESDSFTIEKKQGVGVRIQWTQPANHQDNISDDKVRLLATLKKLLLDEQIVTVQELAETFFVSPTSIMKDLNYIRNEYLNDTMVSLISDGQGTRMVGSEEQFQKTLLAFNELVMSLMASKQYQLAEVKELYPYYPKELVDACLDIVKSLESYRLYSIAAHYERNVFHVLLVISYRLIKGCHLPAVRNAFKVDEVMALKNYLIAKDLLEMLSKKITFAYLDSDIYGLAVYLQANRLEFSPSRTHVDSTYQTSVKNMICRMSECVGVELQFDETLYENVMVHMYHMVYRMKHGIAIRNPLLSDIKEEFRLMFDLTSLVMEEERETLGIKITEDEVAFMMLHFQHALDKKMKSKKLLVVCPKGIVTSGFIINRIRRILPPLDIIEAVSALDAERFDLEHIDLIISTIPLIGVKKPVVIVSPLVTEKDLEAINKVYQEHVTLQENESFIAVEKLAPYVHPDYIYCNQVAQDYRDIIKQVSQQLMNDGYVLEGYEASLLDREEHGGTELATGAAVPHGSLELVNKTIVPIWINKTPIKWGKYHVKVVIFFVLAKADLLQAKAILEEIFKLVKSKHFIDGTLVTLKEEELLAFLLGGS